MNLPEGSRSSFRVPLVKFTSSTSLPAGGQSATPSVNRPSFAASRFLFSRESARASALLISDPSDTLDSSDPADRSAAVVAAARPQLEVLGERLAARDFHSEAKSHRERLHQNGRVRQFVDSVQDRSRELLKLYEDEDGSRSSQRLCWRNIAAFL